MIVRTVAPEEKNSFNQAVDHPLQSWEWGEFRKQTGLNVERVGFFHSGKIAQGIQVTFHPLPILGGTVGYLPKGFMPDDDQIAALKQLAQKHNAVFIKMEPNIAQKVGAPSAHHSISAFLEKNGAVPGRPLFTRHTFVLDLQQSEEKLFANLKSKTRYNVNLAYKRGVEIIEDSSEQGLQVYLDILAETTKRQGFYAHNETYFRTMWSSFQGSDFMRIFHAVYDNQVLVSWIMFVFNGKLYYPYGASRDIHRDVMASNLLMWEMIRFGKQQGCASFDMWGAIGPDPDPKDKWYGFHRFKQGYGGELLEFVGTYDLVFDQFRYKLFRIADTIRWKLLRVKAKISG